MAATEDTKVVDAVPAEADASKVTENGVKAEDATETSNDKTLPTTPPEKAEAGFFPRLKRKLTVNTKASPKSADIPAPENADKAEGTEQAADTAEADKAAEGGEKKEEAAEESKDAATTNDLATPKTPVNRRLSARIATGLREALRTGVDGVKKDDKKEEASEAPAPATDGEQPNAEEAKDKATEDKKGEETAPAATEQGPATPAKEVSSPKIFLAFKQKASELKETFQKPKEETKEVPAGKEAEEVNGANPDEAAASAENKTQEGEEVKPAKPALGFMGAIKHIFVTAPKKDAEEQKEPEVPASGDKPAEEAAKTDEAAAKDEPAASPKERPKTQIFAGLRKAFMGEGSKKVDDQADADKPAAEQATGEPETEAKDGEKATAAAPKTYASVVAAAVASVSAADAKKEEGGENEASPKPKWTKRLSIMYQGAIKKTASPSKAEDKKEEQAAEDESKGKTEDKVGDKPAEADTTKVDDDAKKKEPAAAAEEKKDETEKKPE